MLKNIKVHPNSSLYTPKHITFVTVMN